VRVKKREEKEMELLALFGVLAGVLMALAVIQYERRPRYVPVYRVNKYNGQLERVKQ
jgi:hypothetical protein